MAVTALVIETGLIVSGSDSYVSLVQAEQIVEDWNPPGRATWDLAATTDDLKTAALRYAARHLDDVTQWKGSIQDTDQSMRWPRVGVLTRENQDIEDSTVPEKVRIAQVFLAIGYVDSKILRRDPIRKLVKREKLDVLETEYQEAKQSFNQAFAYDWSDVESMLVPDLAYGISLDSHSSATLGRMTR